MGLLRIYLALCVVIAHAQGLLVPWSVHSGREAVQIFYIISGFYMQLIYSKYHDAIEFYISRVLRIYTPYYAVLLVTIVVSLALGLAYGNFGALNAYPDAFQHNGAVGVIYAALSNITILGQDTVMFLSQDKETGLSFTSQFSESQFPLYRYLAIGPAWTIAVELTFYLLLPFLVRLKQHYLIIIIVTALGARFFAYYGMGLQFDPWTYRFFPFEIALFCIGMTSSRLYLKYQDFFARIFANRFLNSEPYYLLKWIPALLFFYLAVSAVHTSSTRLNVDIEFIRMISYLAWAAVIPFFFQATKRNRMDRFIGELSYPVYLIHMPLIISLNVVLQHYKLTIDDAYNAKIICAASILLSIGLYYAVVQPVDRMRHANAGAIAIRLRGWIHRGQSADSSEK